MPSPGAASIPISGTVKGAMYIPAAFKDKTRDDVDSLFASQGFIQYTTMRTKFMVAKPFEFIQESFPDAVSIGNKFTINGTLVRTLESALHGVVEVSSVCESEHGLPQPPAVRDSPAEETHSKDSKTSNSAQKKSEESVASSVSAAEELLLRSEDAWLYAPTLLPSNLLEADVGALLEHCISSSSDGKLGAVLKTVSGLFVVNRTLFSALLCKFAVDADAVLPTDIEKAYAAHRVAKAASGCIVTPNLHSAPSSSGRGTAAVTGHKSKTKATEKPTGKGRKDQDSEDGVRPDSGNTDVDIDALLIKYTKTSKMTANIKKWCPDLAEEFNEPLLKGEVPVL